MKIIFVYPSRNKRLWVLIFLLSMWAGCELAHTKADETTPQPRQFFNTRDPVEDREYQQKRFMEMLYGKKWIEAWQRQTETEKGQEKHSRQNVPDAEQTPHPYQSQGRDQRARKHPLAQSRKARSLALPVRPKDARRGHYPAYASSPPQGTLYQKTGPLSGGG